jgi:transposase
MRSPNGDKITLIWDGLPSHRSQAMRAFLKKQRKWLVVERLPAYEPDLNPIEQVWAT